MPTKDGWTLEREHEKIQLGRKSYRNMEEWSRPCAICGDKFFIHTRTNAGSVNAAFGLKTCKDHRGQKITGGQFVNTDELETLRMYKSVTKAELDGLYAQIAELRSQLAKHELPAAFRAVQKKMPWEQNGT